MNKRDVIRHSRLCGFMGMLLAILAMASVGRADCRVVSIRSEKKIGAKSYVQYGVGTVFSRAPDDGRRFILTPAHVVQAADSIRARCGQNEFSLTTLGISTTSDMAAFSAPLEARLLPLFSLDGATLSRKTDDGRTALEPAGFDRSVLWNVNWSQEESPNAIDTTCVLFSRYGTGRPILGVEYSIHLCSFGVRPGMSGSPVLDQSGKILGIVTKTHNFDNYSAGISIESIKKHLPKLIQGIDVFGPQSKWGFYPTENLTPSQDGTLTRTRALHVRNGKNQVYTDACPSHAYTETSFWSEVGGKSEWGDGGGNRDSSKLAGKYIRGHRNTSGGVEPFAMYRPSPDSCEERGVKLLDGRILTGIKYYRSDRSYWIETINSVDDLYNLLLLRGGKVLADVKEGGVFAVRPASFDLICGQKELPRGGVHGALKTDTYRSSIVLDGVPMDFASIVFNSSSGSQGNWQYACDSASHSLHVKSFGEPVEVDLRLTNDTVSGHLRIGRCAISGISQPKEFWSAQIKNERMHLEVQIPSYKKYLLRIQVHHLDPTCLDGFSPNNRPTFLDYITWRQ